MRAVVNTPTLRRFAEVLLRSPRYLHLAANLARDERLPPASRAAATAAAGYALLPVDLLPGFIPVLGQLDDLTVMIGGLRAVLRGIRRRSRRSTSPRAGLTAERLDADLAIVGETARWLARGGVRLAAPSGARDGRADRARPAGAGRKGGRPALVSAR